ncbi:MAG: 2-oxo acid dehydrogenase subunit E2 [Halioglobus sp.]|nr:2-oxo acid dehydrogenase subunit E2 [Halioglobus sp.]
MSEIYPIAVPKWGIEMVEGTINTWNKAVGDAVSKGDEVFEMESDKIVNVWDSPVDGVLRRIVVEEGDTQPVGALLGVIAAADVDDAAIDAFIAEFAGAALAGAEPAVGAKEAPAAAAPKAGASDANTRSSPSVRRLAQELGVDLNTVTGTGRRGRITEDDVRAAGAGEGDNASDAVAIIPLTPTRKTIARRLTEAKQQMPHFYLTVEYELDGLLAHRKSLNGSGDSKVSVNDLIVWCVAQALMKEPRVNVNLVGDDIHQFRNANVSVAIATDEGLYPATVRGAEALTPAEIATAVGALAEKAKTGKLAADDISGGSFTVSNLGMFGVTNFTAIVNPPMGAILALGKGVQKMVVKDGQPTVATVISATLSCDHRVIDGAVGAQFLQVLGEEIAALS